MFLVLILNHKEQLLNARPKQRRRAILSWATIDRRPIKAKKLGEVARAYHGVGPSLKSVLRGRDRLPLERSPFVIGLSHEAKSVLVASKPDVQPVLDNAALTVAPARCLAA